MTDGSKRPHDQMAVDHEARNHLRVLIPMLERIGSGSSAQVSVGYVEWPGHGAEKMTETGASMMKLTERVAWDSATYLCEEVTDNVQPGVDTTLVEATQELCAIIAAALAGAEPYEAPSGVSAPWVAQCLLWRCEDLLRRVEGKLERPKAKARQGTRNDLREPPVKFTESEPTRDIVAQIHEAAIGLCSVAEPIADAYDSDPDLLDILRTRVASTRDLIRQVESDTRPADQSPGWSELSYAVVGATLPTVELALGGRGTTPTLPSDRAAWVSPAILALDVGKELKAWAEKHVAEGVADR